MKEFIKKDNTLRLQVFLSHNGVCSRREALRIVQSGDVTVNGGVAREPSMLINPKMDVVEVEGRPVQAKAYAYIMLNKPKGFVTTKKAQFGAKTVFELLPPQLQHLLPAGRLDKDTEGLLVFTNDGDVAFQLTHPKFNLDKTYFVCVAGRLEEEDRLKLARGVYLGGKKTAPAKLKNVKRKKGETELMMTIHEGRKRQIRLMFAKVGHRVRYLKRMSQGPLVLGSLKVGKWRKLNAGEIKAIQK